MPPLGRLKLLAFLPFRKPLLADTGAGKQQTIRYSRLSIADDKKTNGKHNKAEYPSNNQGVTNKTNQIISQKHI